MADVVQVVKLGRKPPFFCERSPKFSNLRLFWKLYQPSNHDEVAVTLGNGNATLIFERVGLFCK
jgi:hypothetical protein